MPRPKARSINELWASISPEKRHLYAEVFRVARARAASREPTPDRPAKPLPPITKHGTSAYKNRGCRCELCKAAWREQQRVYRKGGKPW
jgi:hypothetical protein